jgi:hypothetical protein
MSSNKQFLLINNPHIQVQVSLKSKIQVRKIKLRGKAE